MSTKVEKVKKNIPELRFPGFEGEWEEKRLGEVYSFQATNSLSRDKLNYVSGRIKNIHYGDIHTKFRSHFDTTKEAIPFINSDQEPKYSKSDFIECGDLVLADASEDYADIGKGVEVCHVDGQKVLSGLHTLLLKAKFNDIALGFMGHLIKSPNFRLSIKRVAQGTKVLGISKQYIQKLKFQLPQKAEQQKIASFLTTVDGWIENLKTQKRKWEEYKKGMMQKIFSQEIRFRDENGNDFPDWEEKKFEEIVHGLPTRSFQIKQSEVRLIGKYPVVDQGQELIAGRSNESIKLFKNLPVIVFGDHTTILKFVDFPFVVGADGTKLLKSKDPAVCSDSFLYYLLIAFPVETEGYKRHFSILKNRSIFVPQLEEQQKIAAFLTEIDEMINSHQQKITQAEEWKKGLMQRMFV